MNVFPVRRDDDNELLGFIAQDSTSWTARTLFGYAFERATSRAAAEQIVREQGLAILAGQWLYFDKDKGDWLPCRLQEVYEHKVVVVKTTALGYEDPDDYKKVTITNPTEANLARV